MLVSSVAPPLSAAVAWAGLDCSTLPPQHLAAVDQLRRNAIHFAAARDDALSIAELADRGVPVALQDRRGNAPLHYAALHSAHRALQTLLETPGTLINAQNSSGATPLSVASQLGDSSSVSLLLQAGANPNMADSDQATALHLAAANGHLSVIRLLLLAGAFVNAQDASGDTPLHWAVREERVEAVAALAADYRANLAAKNEDGETALQLAQECGLPAVAAALTARKQKHVAH